MFEQRYPGRALYQTDWPVGSRSLLVAVPCRLDGAPGPFQALLDTAAEWCVLPAEFALELGIDLTCSAAVYPVGILSRQACAAEPPFRSRRGDPVTDLGSQAPAVRPASDSLLDLGARPHHNRLGVTQRLLVFLLGHRFCRAGVARFPREARQDHGTINLGGDRGALLAQTRDEFVQVVCVAEGPSVVLVNRLQSLLGRLLRVEAQILVVRIFRQRNAC